MENRKKKYTEPEPQINAGVWSKCIELVNTLDDKAIKTAQIGRYDLKLDS